MGLQKGGGGGATGALVPAESWIYWYGRTAGRLCIGVSTHWDVSQQRDVPRPTHDHIPYSNGRSVTYAQPSGLSAFLATRSGFT